MNELREEGKPASTRLFYITGTLLHLLQVCSEYKRVVFTSLVPTRMQEIYPYPRTICWLIFTRLFFKTLKELPDYGSISVPWSTSERRHFLSMRWWDDPSVPGRHSSQEPRLWSQAACSRAWISLACTQCDCRHLTKCPVPRCLYLWNGVDKDAYPTEMT